MTTLRIAAQLASAALALSTLSAAASAQGSTRFIASSGNDVNPCSRSQPCRSLQRGIDSAPAGSTLMVVDTAGYGNTAIIDKSITIVADGVSATILANAAGQTGITIDAAGARIVLRGLNVTGGGAGQTGIEVIAAASVHIDDCVIENFTGDGIALDAVSAEMLVTDTVSRNNGGNGLFFYSPAGARLTVQESRFENNHHNGLDLRNINSTIVRSALRGNNVDGSDQSSGRSKFIATISAHNHAHGFFATGGEITLEDAVARGNGGSGLSLLGTTARLSNTVITNNATGIHNPSGGTVLTRGNNTVSGNGTNVDGPLTPLGGT